MKSKEEIEQLAKKLCNIPIDLVIDEEERYYKNLQKYDGIILGYTQCQKDMAEKKLDVDDIKEMALDYIIDAGGLPKTIEEWQNDLWKFYQSLNKQDNEN